jgi:multicomponent Na+:H+ antiporter subunit D
MLYVLLRFDFLVFHGNLEGHGFQFALFLAPLALLGIVFGSLLAVVSEDVKRLLAYSSVAQIGYILLGATFSDAAGLTAAIAHMFNHALAKGALFLGVAAFALRARGVRLDDIAGIGKTMPWTTAAVVIGGASLVGVPGTAGFVSKWLLIGAALEHGTMGAIAVVIIVASSLAALAYVWRIVERAYFGEATVQAAEAREAPLGLLIGVWIAALANLYFGLMPHLPLALSEGAAAELLRHVQ